MLLVATTALYLVREGIEDADGLIKSQQPSHTPRANL